MFLSLDLLWEYRIQHGANGPLYVTSSYSTWIFCRGVSGFATDCPCGVWCRGLTTCLLHVGPPFGNRILNNSWAVGLLLAGFGPWPISGLWPGLSGSLPASSRSLSPLAYKTHTTMVHYSVVPFYISLGHVYRLYHLNGSRRVITTNCGLYSNISQILLLYKTWGYHNNFDFTRSSGACYDVSKYHNAGIWSMDYRYCILCSKTYNTSRSLSQLLAGKQQTGRGACICEKSLLPVGPFTYTD